MLVRALALQALVLAAMAVVAIVVIVEVVLRYTLGQSLVVTEELSRYLMVWVAFLGSVLVIHERGHIAAEGLSGWLGAPGRRRVAVVADRSALPRVPGGPRRLRLPGPAGAARPAPDHNQGSDLLVLSRDPGRGQPHGTGRRAAPPRVESG